MTTLLCVGEVFAGRFELLDPIAEGGMGSVWVVRDRKDGGLYAGKLLRQSDSASLLRFIREQGTRIDHEHVVTPLSWAGEDDRVMFTMPLVRGGSVAHLVGDFGALPLPWVGALLGQTLQALEAVHATGVIHRDVKPANLLLDATGTGPPHVRLTDFGVAVPVDEPRMTRASQVVGSLGYMSPDHLAGADPSPAQDLYGAAVVGLELVSGVRPPQAAAAAADRAAHDPSWAGLVDLLSSVVESRPGSPTTARDFRAALVALRLPPLVHDPDGPVVFEHLRPAPAEPTRVSARRTPTRPDTADPAGAGPDPHRSAGLALVLVGLVCAVAAIVLLLTA